jgi:ubiquinone/menaquinone biosynthesis C-methylase UbiE
MSNISRDAPELADRYDRVSDSQFNRGVLLTKKMGIGAGDAVLDIGCGTGRLAMYLSTVVGPAGRVIGIDPSPYRIDVACEKLKGRTVGNVRFAVGHGESPGDMPSGSFDYICYCSVLHWIDGKTAALSSAYRLLKPAGKVGITTGDRENPSGIKSITNRLFARPPYVGRVKMAEDASMPVTRKELGMLLADAGFTEIKIKLLAGKRYYSSPEEAFAFNEASSFGNFLQHVPESLRSRARSDIAEELEKYRKPAGIELAQNNLCAIARKPA